MILVSKRLNTAYAVLRDDATLESGQCGPVRVLVGDELEVIAQSPYRACRSRFLCRTGHYRIPLYLWVTIGLDTE